MEVTTREPPTPDTDSPAPRPWVCEPEARDEEVIQAAAHEETPTEPGYGHGV
jgi:hypothetical protein